MTITNTLHLNYFGQHVGLVIITTITSQQKTEIELNVYILLQLNCICGGGRKVYYTEMATIGDSHKVVDPRKK
jgi:hypothetical protein